MTSPIASTSYRALSLSLRSCPPLHLAFPKPRFYASLSHQPQKLVSHQVPLVLAATQDKGKGKAVEDMTAEAATQSHVTPPPRVPRRTVGLKGKKAPITMTPTAIDRLRSLLSSPTNPQLIRISVKNRGCAGMAYHLEYVSPPGGKFDEVVEQDGVKVLIDSKALFSIIGSEMDWKEDRLSAKFVFHNPNVKDECGCGESFTI